MDKFQTNLLPPRYFLTKTRDIPTSIYIMISAADIMISILVLPLAIPYLPYNRQGWLLETSPVFCTIWGMLWYVLLVLSIFLVAMLSITRTIQIVCPFRNLRKKAVIGVILGYLVVLIVQSTIPMWFKKIYEYDWYMTNHCTWRNDFLKLQSEAAYHAYTQVIFFETYFPIFPILISCVLTIRSLKSSENSALNQANREVTITIILFTVLYMVCNLPQVVMHFITIIGQSIKSAETLMNWDQPYYYWFRFYMILLYPINSALNPILYLWRMKKMRESTRNMIKRCVKVANQKIGSPLSTTRKMSVTAVTRV